MEILHGERLKMIASLYDFHRLRKVLPHFYVFYSVTLRNSEQVNEIRVGDSESTFHAENDVASHFSLARHTLSNTERLTCK